MFDKLKIVNKNQVIIFAIALMLISVGYLNFTSMNKEVSETSTNVIQYAGIGDAKLVSSSNIEEVNNTSTENNIENTISTFTESVTENNNNEKKKDNINETVTTEAKEIDEYFESSKLTRQTMYSQMIESYQKILENNQISQDQKGIAQTEIKNINDTKNKIMICENLIKVKEIEDVIIFVNDKSISVIVKSKELKQEQIAQIQNIISREMGAEINNIHISNKY